MSTSPKHTGRGAVDAVHDDPFHPSNDPYAHWYTSDEVRLGLLPQPKLSRRDAGRLMVLGACGCMVASCSSTQNGGRTPLGCEPREGAAFGCRHRFCRYYGQK